MTASTPAAYRGAICKVQRLYSIPEVLSQALRLVKSPDVSLESIGQLVSQDAALVADVIRLSNSVMYSRGEACVELQMALQRLGLDEVVRVIGLSLSKHVFGKGLNHYGISAAQYWRASLLGALLMEQLAFLHGVDAPEAYTIGILHALGRVLINEVLGETGKGQPWDRKGSLENWEVGRVGFTHAEAGALLLKEWRFPRAIVNPIENQLGAPRVVPAQSPIGMLRFVRVLLACDPDTATAPANQGPFPPDLLGWAGFASEAEAVDLLVEAQRKLVEIGQSLGVSGGN
jgi:HD-like signal output (HDOD) protein